MPGTECSEALAAAVLSVRVTRARVPGFRVWIRGFGL